MVFIRLPHSSRTIIVQCVQFTTYCMFCVKWIDSVLKCFWWIYWRPQGISGRARRRLCHHATTVNLRKLHHKANGIEMNKNRLMIAFVNSFIDFGGIGIFLNVFIWWKFTGVGNVCAPLLGLLRRCLKCIRQRGIFLICEFLLLLLFFCHSNSSFHLNFHYSCCIE